MKKNFFKKLSFVLASAMVLTAVAPASGAFAAKAPKLNSTSKYLHLGREKENEFNFNVSNKKSGWKYEWTSANEDVVKVNKKNGVVKATGVGSTKVAVVITDKDGEEVDELKAKVTVRDNIATVKISNPLTESLAVGAEHDFNRSFVTESGSKKKTSSITRWTVDSEKATINDKGVFAATEAGEYTVTARSFQSKAKYESWLADAEKYASYVLDTDSTKVKVAPSMIEAKQVDRFKFTVKFDSAVKDVAEKLSLHSVVGGAKVNELIKEVKMDAENKIATVEVYVPFNGGTTYVIGYPGMETVQFVGATQNPEDVVRMEVLTTTAQIGKEKDIEVALYNKDDVNIANEDLLNRVELDTSSTSSYFSGTRKLIMYVVGDTTTITALYHTYNYNLTTGEEMGVIKAVGVVKCTDQSVDNVGEVEAYTLAKDSPDWNDLKHNIAADDSGFKLFVKLKGKDADGNDLETTNIDDINDGEYNFKYTSGSSDILVMDADGSVYPAKNGSVVVVITYNDKVVGAAPITVTEPRKLSNVNLNTSGLTLSNTNNFDDTAIVKVDTAKDQLGSDYKNYTVEIKYNGNKAEGRTLLEDANGPEFKFNARNISAGSYSYTVTVTDNESSHRKFSRSVQISVQKPSDDAKVAYYKMVTDANEYDTKVSADANKTLQEVASKTATYKIYGYASNNVKNKEITSLDDYNLEFITVPGDVSKKDKVAMLADVTTDSKLELVSVSASSASNGALITKLPTGSYTLRATKKDDAKAVPLTAHFTVKDTQPTPVVTTKTYLFSKKADLIEALNDCLSIKLDNETIKIPAGTDIRTGIDTGKEAFVKDFDYYQEINGGYLKHTIKVNKTIRYNQD